MNNRLFTAPENPSTTARFFISLQGLAESLWLLAGFLFAACDSVISGNTRKASKPRITGALHGI